MPRTERAKRPSDVAPEDLTIRQVIVLAKYQTHRELARAAKVSDKTISLLCRGCWPSDADAASIARALRLTVAQLHELVARALQAFATTR